MPLPAWANYNSATGILDITCQVCANHIFWKTIDPVSVTPSLFNERAAIPANIDSHSVICPFMKDSAPCQTGYEIIYNNTTHNVDGVSLSPNTWYDRMLMDMAKRWQENTIAVLDKRAEYLITTIVGLIAVNFGIIYVFNISDTFNFPEIVIQIVPNAILSISVLFFALSHFPEVRKIRLDVPKDILNAYEKNIDNKYKLQKIGYILFVVALIAIAITASVSFYTNPDPVSNVSLSGEITLLPAP